MFAENRFFSRLNAKKDVLKCDIRLADKANVLTQAHPAGLDESLCSSCRMLDDFTHEVDNTHSRLDNVMKKLAKVSHMTSGKLPSHCDRNKTMDARACS